jgi:predicted nuclease with TOPRIM domain
VSNSDRPEFAALDELSRVLEHVKDELASWRRRALKAESERASIGVEHDVVTSHAKIKELETENAQVTSRLNAARRRMADLLARLEFLEEQVELEEQSR